MPGGMNEGNRDEEIVRKIHRSEWEEKRKEFYDRSGMSMMRVERILRVGQTTEKRVIQRLRKI